MVRQDEQRGDRLRRPHREIARDEERLAGYAVGPDTAGEEENDHRDLAREQHVAEVCRPPDLQHRKGERDRRHVAAEGVDHPRADEKPDVPLAERVSHRSGTHRPTLLERGPAAPGANAFASPA